MVICPMQLKAGQQYFRPSKESTLFQPTPSPVITCHLPRRSVDFCRLSPQSVSALGHCLTSLTGAFPSPSTTSANSLRIRRANPFAGWIWVMLKVLCGLGCGISTEASASVSDASALGTCKILLKFALLPFQFQLHSPPLALGETVHPPP